MLYISFVVCKYIFGSLVFIWSINSLFNLSIPFSFKTCIAGIALLFIARLFLRGLNIPFIEDMELEERNLLTESKLFKVLQGGRKK